MKETIADIKDYSKRIKEGKKIESKIILQLRQYGVKIDDPTASEDRYSKIDGWISFSAGEFKGLRKSVQIKYRETGDDILFEMVKDIYLKIPGRDMIGLSDLYLSVDRGGNGKLIKTSLIKKKAKEILSEIEKDLIISPDKRAWDGEFWQVKIMTDRAHGQDKMIAYFEREMFPLFGTWKFNLYP